MKTINLTVGLWAGNAVGWLAVLLALLYQFGVLALGTTGTLPEVRPLTPQPLRIPDPLPAMLAKNPFDSATGHWKIAGQRDAGELRGILLLPGVRVAVTGAGVVHSGEYLVDGKLAEIRQDRLIVRQEDGAHEIKLPSAQRPTLQSLNKSQAKPNKGTP